MPKLTKEERAALEAQLAEDDAAEDEDDEYELGFSDGSYVRGKHSRVAKVAAARGVKVDADPPAGDGKDAKDGKGAAKGQQGGQVRAFGRRVS